MRLTKGIEASDDPVLRVREKAYNFSRDSRLAASGCPFSTGVATKVEPIPNWLDWLDKFVVGLQDNSVVSKLSSWFLVPYWARKMPTAALPGGPRAVVQPSENVQRMMNLIMPLKDKSAIGRAKAARAVAQNVDEIFAGLDNVGTVHFARFLLIGDSICMISVYDGDFTNYIRDFIATIGSVFDEVVKLVEGGEAITPSEKHVDAFIDWVHDHDLFQAPDFPTDLFTLNKECGRDSSRRRPARAAHAAARVCPTIESQSQHFAWWRLSRLSRFLRRGGAPQIRSRLVSDKFDRTQIQGNILRGYNREVVRHLILKVGDRAAARKFLGVSVAGGDADVPGSPTGRRGATRSRPSVSISASPSRGLRALGTPEKYLTTFPTEFAEGMTRRALKLGDFGPSDPKHWPDPFDKPAQVHIVASIYADDEEHLNSVQTQVARAFAVLGSRDGRKRSADKVFFGFKDSISQPRFAEIRDDPDTEKANEPVDPLGTALLGHETSFENLRFRVPEPKELGFNGTFNAFRVLAQDAKGFNEYLSKAANELKDHPDVNLLLAPGSEALIGEGLDRVGALREVVAAQMCGRWRNGIPYGSSPDVQLPDVSRFPRPISITTEPRDVPLARTCGASIRAAGRSCSGSPTTPGA